MVQVVREKDSLHQRLVVYVLSVPELLHYPMRQINIEQDRTVLIISESWTTALAFEERYPEGNLAPCMRGCTA